MSELKIYQADAPEMTPETVVDHPLIAGKLDSLSVLFDRWETEAPLTIDAGQDEVLTAYQDSVDQLTQQFGFQSVDVIALNADHPEKAALRAKFLDEHTHDDYEVRFFVEGQGLFYLHIGDHVYSVLCEKGDLISVPANTPHWFDMGANPFFKCIRLFTTPDGWQANFTGSDIARHFPALEN